MHTFISLEGEKNDHAYPWCWVTQPTAGRDGGHVSICSSEMKTHVSWEHWQTSDVLVCCVTRNGSLPGDWADLSHDLASFVDINSQLLTTVSRENSQSRAVSHRLQVDSEKHRRVMHGSLQNLGVFLTVSWSDVITFSFYKCITRKEWTIK